MTRTLSWAQTDDHLHLTLHLSTRATGVAASLCADDHTLQLELTPADAAGMGRVRVTLFAPAVVEAASLARDGWEARVCLRKVTDEEEEVEEAGGAEEEHTEALEEQDVPRPDRVVEADVEAAVEAGGEDEAAVEEGVDEEGVEEEEVDEEGVDEEGVDEEGVAGASWPPWPCWPRWPTLTSSSARAPSDLRIVVDWSRWVPDDDEDDLQDMV
jgi:hypothetical protein